MHQNRAVYWALIMKMRRLLLSVLVLMATLPATSQEGSSGELKVTVINEDNSGLANSTVALLQVRDSSLVKTAVTDSSGVAIFRNIRTGTYICRVTRVSYAVQHTSVEIRTSGNGSTRVQLKPATAMLQDVTVTARKPFVQLMPDKTVVNVDAGITNAGTTVMEVLEKSPGVTIDRDGNISLKGRSGVQVMIDGKLTMVSGADLANLLNGMNATQVEQIELIDNPSAKYDAAGNAGLINIKLKKNRQRGFNGTLTTAFGQGRYPKTNNNLLVNYRSGSFNFFANYSINANQNILEMFARRTYYEPGRVIPESVLEQPFFLKSTGVTNMLRAGMDYYVSKKTTVGITVNGTALSRENIGDNTAIWINKSGVTDSTIDTDSRNTSNWKFGGLNFNMRHNFDSRRELAMDVDYLRYRIRSDQYFENQSDVPGSLTEANRGDIPSDLEILAAKADYSQRFSNLQWETGWKSSHINTDNIAQYFFRLGNDWKPDLGRTNHFLYTENIHALYTNFNSSFGKWELQSGLRYEYTGYRANQLGNSVVKDSAFTRNYHNLFPSLFVTFNADSINSFTFRAGRRIDRPAFQKLNPFSSIINKYTFQEGNPLILPQYTWNFEVSHLFKQVLSTSLSYNQTNDYFSQIFYSYPDTDTIIYTEGNIGRMRNFGVTISAQLAPAKWWGLTLVGNFTHKKLEGYIWNQYSASISQFNINVNNQFRFKKGWAAELTGFYIGKSQNDLQEVLNPTGQVSAGVSKQIMKGKGTLRLTFRDMFYTQAMGGWTYFESVIEYFRLQRDSRVATVSFTWRFGKAMKQTVKRSNGADDEINRVGTAN
jgi:iron complex outermembrane recepter protein